MLRYYYFLIIFIYIIKPRSVFAFYKNDCGPYGFICDGMSRLRLCEGNKIFGPGFLCPSNTICNEESADVCEDTINYIDSTITRGIRCHRSERIADQSVPNCKGYILCIPNKNRFQGIKFKCSGSTVFSGYTRTCTAPDKYKCPLENVTKPPQFYKEANRRVDNNQDDSRQPIKNGHRPIDCKSYKFTLTQDNSPVRATYFCPSRPVAGESSVRCTVFSNQFCITLERDNEDQFIQAAGAAYRRPRTVLPKI